MSLTVLLIGFAHSFPAIIAGGTTNRRSAVIFTTFLMILFAIFFGSSKYIVYDLVGVALGALVGLSTVRES